jgi:hypothetical protein
MLNQQTLDKLYTLKLTGMAEAFTETLLSPAPPVREKPSSPAP